MNISTALKSHQHQLLLRYSHNPVLHSTPSNCKPPPYTWFTCVQALLSNVHDSLVCMECLGKSLKRFVTQLRHSGFYCVHKSLALWNWYKYTLNITNLFSSVSTTHSYCSIPPVAPITFIANYTQLSQCRVVLSHAASQEFLSTSRKSRASRCVHRTLHCSPSWITLIRSIPCQTHLNIGLPPTSWSP
jgi:hypothetical protein